MPRCNIFKSLKPTFDFRFVQYGCVQCYKRFQKNIHFLLWHLRLTLLSQVLCFWPCKLFSFISKNWLVHGGDLHLWHRIDKLLKVWRKNILLWKYILLLSCNTSLFHFSAVSTLISKFLFNIAQCWWVMRPKTL